MENSIMPTPSLHPSNGRGPRPTARSQDRDLTILRACAHPPPTPQPASSRGQTGKGACVALERGKQTHPGQSRYLSAPRRFQGWEGLNEVTRADLGGPADIGDGRARRGLLEEEADGAPKH